MSVTDRGEETHSLREVGIALVSRSTVECVGADEDYGRELAGATGVIGWNGFYGSG